MTRRPYLDADDPNADLEHSNVGTYGAGGDCLTCGVKWPCPTEVRRVVATMTTATVAPVSGTKS